MSGLPNKAPTASNRPASAYLLPPEGGPGGEEQSLRGAWPSIPKGGRLGTPQRRDGGGGWGRIVFFSRVIDTLLAFYFLCRRSWIWFAVGFSPFTLVLSFRLRYYCTAIFQQTNPAVTMANISTIITICSLLLFVLFVTLVLFFAFGFSLTCLRFVFEIMVSLL